MKKIQRPQLTLKILFYAIFDVAGMILFATGALWLAKGQALFVPDFPANTAEAFVALAGGLLLMFWAAARILRELLNRSVNPSQESE